jgi:hypothetical protein
MLDWDIAAACAAACWCCSVVLLILLLVLLVLLEIPVRLLPELQEQRPRLLLPIAWATFATSSFQFLVCFLFSVVLFVLTRLFNISMA